MLLFGGRGDRGKIFNDTWIYHYEEQTWRSSVNPDILAQIGTKGMYTYGNGGASIGSGIDDYSAPYVLSQTEHRDLVRGPSPSPRYFSSCVVASGQGASSNDVYLFGGTDGIDNFGDLWVFRGDPLVMKWERLVAVGLPPSPRYGVSSNIFYVAYRRSL